MPENAVRKDEGQLSQQDNQQQDNRQDVSGEGVQEGSQIPVIDWEHKYKTLQGKYNAEMGRLQTSLRDLQAENEALKTELKTLKEMIEKRNTTEANEEMLQNLKETFPEIYDVLKQMSSRFVTRDELDRIKAEVAQEIQPVMKTTFEAQLTALVPDWQQLNVDPDFIDWLQQKAPFSTKTLHEMMLDAYNAGDAQAVAQFFIEYKNQKKQKSTLPPQTNVSPVGRQVARTTTSPRLIKREEIVKFYRDCALGRYTPEEKAKKEEEIRKAIEEGRVID